MKTLVLSMVAIAAASGAHAEDLVGNGLALTFGAGVQSTPGYFGSSENSVAGILVIEPTELKLGSFSLGGDDDKEGFDLMGSLRIINPRSSIDYAELAGMADVDLTVEAGGGVKYLQRASVGRPGFEVYGVARYGVIGHEAWVGEIGGDVIYQASPLLTLKAGPRMLWGDDKFAATYFGVTGAEAAASNFDAFEASAGIVSRGVQVSAEYAISNDWNFMATLNYDEFVNDAAASPIVQQGSTNQMNVTVTVTRDFTFNF